MTGPESSKTNLSDFTTGSIPKKLIRFMLPIFASVVLQSMYGAVDLFVVGHFSSTAAVSAVSTGSALMDMVMFMLMGLTTGVTILVSQHLGRKDSKRLADTIGGSVVFFLVVALVLTALFLIFAPTFARWMHAPEEAFDMTVAYIRICGCGMIGVVYYNTISSLYRGFGNSTLPLLFVAIACACNIAGDLLLVGVFNMHAPGAAIATITAQAISVIVALLVTRKRTLPFELKRDNIRFNHEVKAFTRLGTPIAIQNFMTTLSFLAMCSFINHLGLIASSGYGVANKITSFTQLIPSTLLTAMSPFIGQNVGAGSDKRARSTMRWGMLFGLIVGIPVCTLIILRGDLPASIFIKDRAVIAQAAAYLLGYSIEPIVTSVLFCLMSYFNGYGRTRFVMIQGLVQSLAIRLPVAYFMSIRPDTTLTKIGFATPSSTIVGIILCLIYFAWFRKKRKEL